MKVILVFGTRPEAIKMAPVVKALESDAAFESKVLVTAQHREMLDQVLDFFNISPDFDLNVMKQGQSIEYITEETLRGVSEILKVEKPDAILVHGDTTTTFAACLAATYLQIPVGHIEAGMRTGDITQPFPEELNRTLVDRMARWNYAPSHECEQNLFDEGIAHEKIIRTSHNTGVSALLLAQKELGIDLQEENNSHQILVTAHRRESWGEGMREIFGAVRELAQSHAEMTFKVATHANPIVADDAHVLLDDVSNVDLLGPQAYGDFVRLMATSRLIMSDSGGVQEEGPTLGVPVVVMRNKTEYHELIEAGAVYLAGTSREKIVAKVEDLLASDEAGKRVYEFACRRSNIDAVSPILDALKQG